MAIQSTTLTTIPESVYTSTNESAITVMYFCNTANVAVDFSLYAAPSGTSTIDSSIQLYKDIQITANDTYLLDTEKLILSNGDALYASASANTSIVTTVSYIGI